MTRGRGRIESRLIRFVEKEAGMRFKEAHRYASRLENKLALKYVKKYGVPE